jgi:hypothetical protein
MELCSDLWKYIFGYLDIRTLMMTRGVSRGWSEIAWFVLGIKHKCIWEMIEGKRSRISVIRSVIAAKHGDLEVLKTLGFRTYSDTAYKTAIQYGHLNVIQFYRGLGIRALAELSTAARYGQMHIMEYLASDSLQFYSIGEQAKAMEYAVQRGDMKMVLFLQKQHINLSKSDLLGIAVRNGNIEMIEYFLELEDDDGESANKPMRRIMIWAIVHKQVEVMKHYWDVRDWTEELDFLLSKACEVGNLEAAKFLVDHGAEIKWTHTNKCHTYRSTDMLKYFAEKGVVDERTGEYVEGKKRKREGD